MIKHHYKDYISQYVTWSGGKFIHSSADEFPMMLKIDEDICGRRLGLCRYAYIDIGLAPRNQRDKSPGGQSP